MNRKVISGLGSKNYVFGLEKDLAIAIWTDNNPDKELPPLPTHPTLPRYMPKKMGKLKNKTCSRSSL